MAAEIPVRIFDRDGEVYADCVDLDLMAQGDTDEEALEALSKFIIAYYGARALGLPEGGPNLRNRLLRMVYPDADRFALLPEPSEQVVAEHAEKLRGYLELEHLRYVANPIVP
jgi:hypothetical protein